MDAEQIKSDAEQIKSLATSVNRVVENHTRPLRVKIERLQAVNKDLLDLLNDILEWQGILPHSKARIRATIAAAEKTV